MVGGEGDIVSQTRVLGTWPVGEDRTAFDISDEIEDLTPNAVHHSIYALVRWGQVERVGSIPSPLPHGGSPRAVYRRLW